MIARPSGTVTFLFTDIESSTVRWEHHQSDMGRAVARHDEILREAIERHGGYVDVTGFSSGSKVKDPYSNRIFLVP